MPSAWEVLTSAPCLSRAATFARSCFSAASANEAADWACDEPLPSKNTISPAANTRFQLIARDSSKRRSGSNLDGQGYQYLISLELHLPKHFGCDHVSQRT